MEKIVNGTMLSETYWDMAEFAAKADKSALEATRDLAERRPEFVFPPGTEPWRATFGNALKLATDGWSEQLPDTLTIAEDAVRMADREHTMDSFEAVWDVTGGAVDVARYLSGEPECMIDFPLTQTSKQGRVITLAVGTAISGSVSADTYLRRGRGIVALALALARLGHAIEIWAYDSSICNGANSDHYAHLRVCVKSAHDEIDPARLMFTLAHPAMHRALMWAVRDKIAQPWRKGLSMRAKRGLPNNTTRDAERDLYPEGAIILPGIRSYDDIPDPEEFVREQLGELGLLAE
jgi:hypothetical protein